MRRRSVRRSTALSGRVVEGVRPALCRRTSGRRSGFGPVARHEHGDCCGGLFLSRTEEIRRAPDDGDGKARERACCPGSSRIFFFSGGEYCGVVATAVATTLLLTEVRMDSPTTTALGELVAGITHPNRVGPSECGRTVLNWPHGLKVSRTVDDMGVVGFLFEDVLRHVKGQSGRSD